MDTMSDFDNSDIMVRSDNINPNQLRENKLVKSKNHLFSMTLSLIYLQGRIFTGETNLETRIMKTTSLEKRVFWNH